MKRFRPDRMLLPILLLLLISSPLMAQPDEPFEYPELEPDGLTYVGLGLGLTPIAQFINLDDLNTLGSEFQLDEFEGPLLLWSGMLIFTPIQFQGARVGIFGAIGYHKQTGDMALPDGVLVTRTLRFGVRFMAGGALEYPIPLTRKLTVLPGFVAGRGSSALELTQSRKGTEQFGNVMEDSLFNSSGRDFDNPNRAARMLHTNWFLQPSLAVEYALTGNIMVRGAGGYHLGFGGEWMDEGGTVYTGVPDISLNAPFAQVGIFLGLFMQ